MKLRKIISGGQSGADKAGLEEAKRLGLETGGTAPKGFWTELGPDLELRDKYSLVESDSSTYPPRTRANVRDAEATIWFGNVGSPGYKCTFSAAQSYSRPFYVNPTPEEMVTLSHIYNIINVAGNRKSTFPQVVELTKLAFSLLKEKS